MSKEARDPRSLAMFAGAGIVAPIWFTVLVIVQGRLQPDYSHAALPISALAAWPYGWIQNLNFYVYGVLVTILAIGLHRGIRPTSWGAVGPTLLVLVGLGAIVAAIFPWRMDNGAPIESSGHIAGAVMHFFSVGLGLLVVSRRMAADAGWQPLAPYMSSAGITLLALFVVFAVFVLPDDAMLHPWAGVVQRVIVAVWFACLIVLATRLRRLARAGDVPVRT